MAETYCGKSCGACAEKQRLNCPGCRMGPGKVYGGECDISKCCNTRGHSACEDCTTASTCVKLRGSAGAAQSRLKNRETDNSQLRIQVNDSAVLGKWLMILFWVIIVSSIINFVLGFTENIPGMKMPVEIIGAVFGVLYGLLLLKLSDQSQCFNTAGVFRIVNVGLSFIIMLLGTSDVALIVSLAALIPSFIAEYQEYIGYVQVTEKMDEDMGRKWSVLWYWCVGSLIAMAVGTALTMLGLLIGALAVLLASILTIVVSVIKVIYLYNAAKMFREYAEENQYNV